MRAADQVSAVIGTRRFCGRPRARARCSACRRAWQAPTRMYWRASRHAPARSRPAPRCACSRSVGLLRESRVPRSWRCCVSTCATACSASAAAGTCSPVASRRRANAWNHPTLCILAGWHACQATYCGRVLLQLCLSRNLVRTGDRWHVQIRGTSQARAPLDGHARKTRYSGVLATITCGGRFESFQWSGRCCGGTCITTIAAHWHVQSSANVHHVGLSIIIETFTSLQMPEILLFMLLSSDTPNPRPRGMHVDVLSSPRRDILVQA